MLPHARRAATIATPPPTRPPRRPRSTPCRAPRRPRLPRAQLVRHAHRRAHRQGQHPREQQVVEVERHGHHRHRAPGVREASRQEHQYLVAPPLQAGVEAAGNGQPEEPDPLAPRLLHPSAAPSRLPSSLRDEHVAGEHDGHGQVADPHGGGDALDAPGPGHPHGEGDVERQGQGGGEQRGERHPLRAQVRLERVDEGGDGEVREEAHHVAACVAAHVRLLSEPEEDGVHVQPQEGDGDGRAQQQDGGHHQRLAEELPVAGAVRLPADGVHGGAEAGEDGEAGDIGEAEAEGAGGELEVAEAAEEGGGDGQLGEPGEVHGDERERDAALRPKLAGHRLRPRFPLVRRRRRWRRHGRVANSIDGWMDQVRN